MDYPFPFEVHKQGTVAGAFCNKREMFKKNTRLLQGKYTEFSTQLHGIPWSGRFFVFVNKSLERHSSKCAHLVENPFYGQQTKSKVDEVFSIYGQWAQLARDNYTKHELENRTFQGRSSTTPFVWDSTHLI